MREIKRVLTAEQERWEEIAQAVNDFLHTFLDIPKKDDGYSIVTILGSGSRSYIYGTPSFCQLGDIDLAFKDPTHRKHFDETVENINVPITFHLVLMPNDAPGVVACVSYDGETPPALSSWSIELDFGPANNTNKWPYLDFVEEFGSIGRTGAFLSHVGLGAFYETLSAWCPTVDKYRNKLEELKATLRRDKCASVEEYSAELVWPLKPERKTIPWQCMWTLAHRDWEELYLTRPHPASGSSINAMRNAW